MRFNLLVFAAITFLSASCPSISDAQKDQPQDPRLAQSVSIECVNMRLHAALDRLTETTGVAIRAGTDGRDWQVRDIPVTICVKDMPLGKLLQTIAASTHLLLSKERVGENTVYRVWRDMKRRRELEDFFKARAAADTAKADWDWEAACKAKATAGDGQSKDIYRTVGSGLGGMLSALGPDAKNLVMSGTALKLNLESASLTMRPLLEGLFKDAYQASNAKSAPLTAEELKKCGLVVDLSTDTDAPNIEMTVGIPPSGDRSYGMANSYLLGSISQYVPAEDLAEMPKPPSQPNAPQYDRPEGEWPELGSKDSKDVAALQTKISLEEPKDRKSITCGSLLAALSKASGYAIVCEDFESHRKSLSPEKLFKKDTTLGEVLRGLDYNLAGFQGSGFVWNINEKDKLIIGTASEWPFHHKNLVSESFLGQLRAKLDGDGVYLDDYLTVLALERGQDGEWISLDPEFAILDAYGTPSYKDMWMLYASLTSGEKARAQTAEGLRMTGLHPAYVGYLISQYNEVEANSVRKCPFQMPEPDPFPYDDQSVANLVMKVVRKHEPCRRMERGVPDGEELLYPAGDYMADKYNLTLEVEQNGNTRTMNLGGPVGLPFRSPEREKALGIKPEKK